MPAPGKSTVAEQAATRTGRGRAVFAVCALVASLAVLLSLGTWQMQRLAWKERLLADMTERRYAAPVAIEAIEQVKREGGDIEYRPVTVTGVFDHGRERHFLATFDGQSGYHVYTPLQMADGRFVFVNRGFVPYDRKEPQTRREGEVEGVQAISGLARDRLAGKPSSLVPDNDLVRNVFYWKDLLAMASSDSIAPEALVPFFVDAGDAPNPGGLPVGGVTQFDLPNNHLQYAMTWYGLALALVGVSGFYIWRSRR
jgi:surfeit locus 1 family protein